MESQMALASKGLEEPLKTFIRAGGEARAGAGVESLGGLWGTPFGELIPRVSESFS